MRGFVFILIALVLASPLGAADGPEPLLRATPGDARRPDFAGFGREDERSSMVSRQIAARGVSDKAVLAAMRRVPRHEFVPARQRARAYHDSPLPIGHGQTISQPFIVGFMTEILDLEPGDKVLEVGTGSGYQAAVLAEIVDHVVSVEIIRPLATATARALAGLGYRNLTLLHGDGYFGWTEAGPYDAIIVTAAAGHVPPPLVAQLTPGGRMVIPVGQSAWTQNLLLVEKDADGRITTRNLMAVRFVPLTGGH